MILGGETMNLLEGVGCGLVVAAAFLEALRIPKVPNT